MLASKNEQQSENWLEWSQTGRTTDKPVWVIIAKHDSCVCAEKTHKLTFTPTTFPPPVACIGVFRDTSHTHTIYQMRHTRIKLSGREQRQDQLFKLTWRGDRPVKCIKNVFLLLPFSLCPVPAMTWPTISLFTLRPSPPFHHSPTHTHIDIYSHSAFLGYFSF